MFISLSAFLLAFAQMVFVVNFFWSLKHGPVAVQKPWHANSLEWTTTPPPHGNWGASYRLYIGGDTTTASQGEGSLYPPRDPDRADHRRDQRLTSVKRSRSPRRQAVRSGAS